MSKAKGKLGDFSARFLVNSISSLFLALFIFFAEFAYFRPVFTGAVAAVAAVALWEYYKLVSQKGPLPSISVGIAIAILYVFAVYAKTSFSFALGRSLPEIVLGTGFFACFVREAKRPTGATLNIASTFFGIVYVAIPLGLCVRIAYFFLFEGQADPHFQGSFWLLYLIAVTKSADMGGYFIGRFWGRRKLARRVSPNKTLEGAIGGLFSAVLMSVFLVLVGQKWGSVFAQLSLPLSVVLGVLIGVAGQLGDLAESLLKRDCGMKDSGTIPGVGGVLDMVDSLLFTAPVVYIFLKIHYA